MIAYDESTGSPVIWRSLIPFMFLEYLNTYICFIFFTNILVYKMLFFIVFRLSLHLGEFMRVFSILMPVSVQQWRVEIEHLVVDIFKKLLPWYISRYPESCNFSNFFTQNCIGRIFFRLFVEIFCNFIFFLYLFDSWRYWGKPRTKKELLYQSFFLSLEFK